MVVLSDKVLVIFIDIQILCNAPRAVGLSVRVISNDFALIEAKDLIFGI